MLRRLQKAYRVGKSVVVSLPSEWVRGNGLSPGDEVELEYDSDRVIVRVAQGGSS